jgi:hypothetical protein
MVVATALDLSNAASIAIAVVLAFIFGYSLTLGPVVRAGVVFAARCRWLSHPILPRSP